MALYGFFMRIFQWLVARIEFCHELEKLKTENREDVYRDQKNYARNLRLLGLKNTPELHQAAKEDWDRKLARNAAKPCPYTGENN